MQVTVRQAGMLTATSLLPLFFFHNYCPVKNEPWCYCFRQPHFLSPIPIILKKQPTPPSPPPIQSPSIIHSIHQSHLNTSSKQAVLSVSIRFSCRNAGGKQTGRICLPIHAWTIIRHGCLSAHSNPYVWKFTQAFMYGSLYQPESLNHTYYKMNWTWEMSDCLKALLSALASFNYSVSIHPPIYNSLAALHNSSAP